MPFRPKKKGHKYTGTITVAGEHDVKSWRRFKKAVDTLVKKVGGKIKHKRTGR
jgi:hypothetical protein